MLLALLVVPACAFPATMGAWVAESPSSQDYTDNFATPVLGDLNRQYGHLPTDCEYLIKVEYSSVNPSDINPQIAHYPHVTGSDMAGAIVAKGPSCRNFDIGDEVWGDIGANTQTKAGLKTKQLGGYGQYTLALETQIAPVPSTWNTTVAGVMGKVALTSYKALAWYAGALNDTLWSRQPTVLVLGGSGGTGTTGLQLARHFGAGQIIATTSAGNFQYCTDNGATTLIDYHTQNWWEVLGANSVDVIYDTVGQAGTGDRAMALLRTGGYFVTIAGQLASKVKPGCHQSSFINSDTNLSNLVELRALTALGQLGVLSMRIAAVVPASQMEEAFNLSRSGRTVGKVAIQL